MSLKFACAVAIVAVQLAGQPVLPEKVHQTFDGHAHWYGGQFHGRRTASGVVFDKTKLTAAHPSLPFGTRVRVTSRYSHKSVVVIVNDRCPALRQRCIDVSEGAAKQLGIYPYAPCAVHCEVIDKEIADAGTQPL
jgi:rare lipoprotein A